MGSLNFRQILKRNKRIYSAYFSIKTFYYTFKSLKKLNIIKTIYINFKTQKIKSAIRFPILLFNHVDLAVNGKIEIIGDKYIGKIRIGKNIDQFVSSNNSFIRINGTIIFRGEFMASNGVTIVVSENALLEIGDVVSLGGSAKIRCCNHIKIGDGTGIVEECQVFDSNFHHMMDTETNEIYPANGVIEIGNLCWIGNRTTISKGTILPNYTIVASNSLVNKSFSKYGGTYPIIGGTPATLISKGKVRIYNIEEEAILFKSLRDSPNYIFQSNYDYSITTGLLWRKKTFNLMRRLF